MNSFFDSGKQPPEIDAVLVTRLVSEQFPQWADLAVKPVSKSGMSNASFHLGADMMVRMPKKLSTALQLEVEYESLTRIASGLPLPVSRPIAIGNPAIGYPWKWAVYGWVEGEVALPENVPDQVAFAEDLARFLKAMHALDTTGGPAAGARNHFRGCSLFSYDEQARQAINKLDGKIDTGLATELWKVALSSSWSDAPVWIHGDVSAENLLVRNGRLCGVIDFGDIGIGDPACDLAMCWNIFDRESREAFRSILPLDPDTWARGRGWVLWKSMIIAAEMCHGNAYETSLAWNIIEKTINDHRALENNEEGNHDPDTI